MKKNMSSLDRIIRVIIAALLGALYLSNVVAGTVGIIILIIAVVLLVTAAIGFCPMYVLLGVSTLKPATTQEQPKEQPPITQQPGPGQPGTPVQ